MTSTEIFRYITLISSLFLLILMVVLVKRKRELYNTTIFPFILMVNIFLRSFTILFLVPLNPNEIIFYNNWGFVITLQTIIMLGTMLWFQYKREKII